MIADKIMTWCWGKEGLFGSWDKNSPAHCWWMRQVKKKKRSTIWWKENYKRIWNRDEI